MYLLQPKHQQGYWSLNYPPCSPTLLFDLKISYSSESHRPIITIFKVIAFNLFQICQPSSLPLVLSFPAVSKNNRIFFSSVLSVCLCYFARVLMTLYFITLSVLSPCPQFPYFSPVYLSFRR